MNNIQAALAKAREARDKKLAICKECPELRQSIMQCKICGCFIPVKAAIANQHCPLDKW